MHNLDTFILVFGHWQELVIATVVVVAWIVLAIVRWKK